MVRLVGLHRLTVLALGVIAVNSLALAEDAADAVLSTMRVPEGFTVERVAGAPLVEHPLMAGFDERGRLFVADNAGLNLAADELLEQTPNMVRMLEDTDGDGRFDRSTLFADKMTFPQGAAWFRGALFVASPPSIWRLQDTDGDGVADRRDEVVTKFGFTGNAADIHGCFVTPTGRIAWCDGRHGHDFEGSETEPASKGLAARVFSCRADGSEVEVFCGGGMDNPVEVAFSSAGDTFGTMTFYNPDEARHDALVHFVYGGVYPKKHPCTAEFKRTGELMPALSRFGVTAPSGLACYASAAWGDAYRDNLFSAQFNTHKIVRHALTRQGATYSAADEDFLTSTSADFHPTDVLMDADGSLLVIDTGGWFHIGCPTSQIAKPEIGGAIYRIRKKDAARPDDPRGLKIAWRGLSDTEMADILEDERPAVVERAVEILAARGDGAIGTLATVLFESADYRARQQAVWALARSDSDACRLLLRQALEDDDAQVRQAAAHAVSDLRDAESVPQLLTLLDNDEPAVRREAATALGRIGRGEAVSSLLRALDKPADRFVEHAVIYALIEINDREATRAGLQDESPRVRRGALVALDQMDDGKLTRPMVEGLMGTDDAELLRAVVDVLARHTDWSESLVELAGRWLKLPGPSADQLATIRGAVTALGDQAGVQKVVAEALADAGTAKSARLTLLEVIARIEYGGTPTIWSDALRALVASPDAEVARQAILTVDALDLPGFDEPLLAIGLDASSPRAVRLAALGAAAHANVALPQAGFEFLLGQLGDDVAPTDRLAAAEALGRFDLTDEQLVAAARLLARCGPLEVSLLLRAFDDGGSAAVGRALVEALGSAKTAETISGERLREVFEKFPDEVRTSAKPLVDRQSPDEAQRVAKLESLQAIVAGGDAARGEELFFSARAACSACHRVGERGEKIGPDLSKIGEARARRDLLEAVVFPSASLARGFESFQVVTSDGKVHSGLLGRETATSIYLRTTERAEIRIARSEIDELAPHRTSIMPDGLEKALSPRELSDVIAYLESLR